MGGTSTDVSRYAGRYDHVFETTTAGVTIQAPQLDINTVAAGGGSCLVYRAGLFLVVRARARTRGGLNPHPTSPCPNACRARTPLPERPCPNARRARTPLPERPCQNARPCPDAPARTPVP